MQYLTPQQVANYCGVSERTVEDWLQNGRITAFAKGNESRVKTGDLLRFMDQNHLAIPSELLDAHQFTADQLTPKVLIADEDRAFGQLVERVVKSLGLDTITVNNGYDASVAFIRRRPDLMILDLKLSGMTGLELIQNAKESHDHESKILVISGAMPRILAKARESGADAALQKPIDEDTLRRTVRIILNRS